MRDGFLVAFCPDGDPRGSLIRRTPPCCRSGSIRPRPRRFGNLTGAAANL